MAPSTFVAWALAVPAIVQAQTSPPCTLDQVLELAARQNPEGSYQAGKLSLIDLLVIRREGVAACREALDAQLNVALAMTELRLVAVVIESNAHESPTIDLVHNTGTRERAPVHRIGGWLRSRHTTGGE